MSTAYDAILFDFDGVLVDSEPLHHEVWNLILAPYGIRLEWDVYQERCIGVSDKEMIRELCAIAGQPEIFEELWNQYPRKKAIFRDRMLEGPPMTDGTKALLAELQGRNKLALVTSSGRLEVEPVLELTGVHRHFSALVFGDEVTRLKPHPEPYLTAATRLGAVRPLVVEDSAAGEASGRAAGFDVLRIAHASELTRKLAAWLDSSASTS